MKNTLKSVTRLIHHSFSFAAHTAVVRNHQPVEKVTVLTALCVLGENRSKQPGPLTRESILLFFLKPLLTALGVAFVKFPL